MVELKRFCNDAVLAVYGYMEPEQCRQLIARSEQIGYEEARVGLQEGDQMLKGIRNNDRAELEDMELAAMQFNQSQIFLPEMLDGWKLEGLFPRFRFYKYGPGHRFKKHRDGRKVLTGNRESRYTWMVYLNDNYQGGSLGFETGETIQPKTGMLVVFPHELKHESLPVIAGEKYVLRTDTIYAQLPLLAKQPGGEPAPADYNLLFSNLVSKVFDEFFTDMGYEVVQNEREAWSATYKYKNYRHNVAVAFKYSGFPDGRAYYEIKIYLATRTVPLEWACKKLHPQYQAGQDQFVTMVKNDYRLLLDEEFEARLHRHLWEMKLLCIDLLRGAPLSM